MIYVVARDSFLEQVREYLPENPVAVELGVYQGNFSQMILTIIKPQRLFLIDPFEVGEKLYSNDSVQSTAYSTEVDYNRTKTTIESNKEWLQSTTIIKKYSYDAIHRFGNKVFDFVYHDASHLYEDLKTDLEQWLPKMKAGSLVCGHDYIELEGFGVKQAVDEFCSEHNFEMIIFNENGGDYALRAIQQA